MQQIPATRKHDDSQYGTSGHFYYHWPDLKSVFKCDYAGGLKFNPADNTEELTLREYLLLKLKYDNMRIHAARRHDDSAYNQDGPYYYYHGESDSVFKSDTREVFNDYDDVVELTVAEYIDYSIRYDQNPEDTLL